MIVLRPTRKLQKLLPLEVDAEVSSDTALGDWYANRLVVDRQPLLLLVCSKALLSIVIPARDVRNLPDRLCDLVRSRLWRLRVPVHLIDREIAAMTPVRIAKTVDRRVLGIMVEYAKMIPYFLEPNDWDESTLQETEDRLWQNPCFAGRPFDEVIFPDKTAPELLVLRWGSK